MPTLLDPKITQGDPGQVFSRAGKAVLGSGKFKFSPALHPAETQEHQSSSSWRGMEMQAIYLGGGRSMDGAAAGSEHGLAESAPGLLLSAP